MKLFVGKKPVDPELLKETVILELPSAEDMHITEEERDEVIKEIAAKFLFQKRYVYVPGPSEVEEESVVMSESKLAPISDTRKHKIDILRNLAQTTNSAIEIKQ